MFVVSIYRTLLFLFEWIQRHYFSKPASKGFADRKDTEVCGLSILDIPTEILLYHVFARCDARTLCEVSISNRILNQIASDHLVWRSLAKSALSEELKKDGKQLIFEQDCDEDDINITEEASPDTITYDQLKQQKNYEERLACFEKDPKHFYLVNTITNRWLSQKRLHRVTAENSRAYDFILEENLLLHKANRMISGPMMELFRIFNSPMNNAISFSSWILIYIFICLKLDFDWPKASYYPIFIPYITLSVMTLSAVVLISYFRMRGLIDNEHVRERVSGWVSSLCYSTMDSIEAAIVVIALGCFFFAFPVTLMLKLDACRTAASDVLTLGQEVTVAQYMRQYCVNAGWSWIAVLTPLFTFFTALLCGICKDIIRLASARQRVLYVAVSVLVYLCFQSFLLALALRLDRVALTETSWWTIFSPMWMIEVVLVLFLVVCYRQFSKESLSSYFGLQLVYFPVFLFQLLICCYLQGYFSYISFAFVHIWILQLILAMILHESSKKYGVWRSFSFKRRIQW